MSTSIHHALLGMPLVILLLAIPACADGAEDSTDRSAVPDRAESTTATRGAGSTGSATLVVGGETYEFDRVHCGFGPEETGQDDIEFTLSAIQDGLQLDATIMTRFGHVVSVDDIEDLENPRVAWSAGGPGSTTGDIIRVDGKHVQVETTFTDQNTGTTANGTLEAQCP